MAFLVAGIYIFSFFMIPILLYGHILLQKYEKFLATIWMALKIISLPLLLYFIWIGINDAKSIIVLEYEITRGLEGILFYWLINAIICAVLIFLKYKKFRKHKLQRHTVKK